MDGITCCRPYSLNSFLVTHPFVAGSPFNGKGKVEIQAQGDEMTLDALKDIRISSSEGKLIISAKQEIVLTSGGGYIRIADGTVECAAPDKIIERGAVWQKFGGQSLSQAMQSLGKRRICHNA